MNERTAAFNAINIKLSAMPVRQVRQRRFTSNLLRSAFDAIPGKRTLGVYRFLPFFFFLGATLEFSMINWTVGDTNFCKGIEFNL